MIAGFCLHPEESAGGVLAELELGDVVAVQDAGVSLLALGGGFPPDLRVSRGVGVSFRAVFTTRWSNFRRAHT